MTKKPPKPPTTHDDNGANQTNIQLIQNQFLNRPEAFVDALEKHNPGIIKRITDNNANTIERNQLKREHFGALQAYVALTVQICMAAFSVWFLVDTFIYDQTFQFTKFIGAIILLSISQSGFAGFIRVVSAFTDIISEKFGKK